ncbi:MAG: hypothetical protein HC836_07580 [Richelia sp. RM2_1_2]|nr:hypothetical protein [Richelia sp. SM1_7_0]NJN11978.1 hypothetical protein [Richelia sp. RM1_1_1]NJO27112.1 hypothetical protein [Richelia sp. SL_2_1]NJO58217.1 hypothetical protein [Richelia sp. RM2_1_2]NJS16183.1 hypothetical protein [Nostocaceae cyanobacterium CSU_2_110]
MTTVTTQEIAQFRSTFANYPQAMQALDLIEDCDGDLEDATMTLAIKVGQQPEIDNSEWLDNLARKWRAVICQQELRGDLLEGSVDKLMEQIQKMPTFPTILATPVLIYVFKQGISDFCSPLDFIIE